MLIKQVRMRFITITAHHKLGTVLRGCVGSCLEAAAWRQWGIWLRQPQWRQRVTFSKLLGGVLLVTQALACKVSSLLTAFSPLLVVFVVAVFCFKEKKT